MDVNLRYQNDEKNIAETSYLDTNFLPGPNVEYLQCELVASITDFDMAKFLQLLMDGPNTNWNVSNVVNNTQLRMDTRIWLKLVAGHSTLFMMPFKYVQQKQDGS